MELLYPAWGETRSYNYITEGYPSFLLGPNLNLSGYVVNIEEESEVYRTPAPKTVHILYTTIIFMSNYNTTLHAKNRWMYDINISISSDV